MDKKKEREIGTFDREDKKPIPVSPCPLPTREGNHTHPWPPYRYGFFCLTEK
jgi:hypothetical protein